MVPSFPKLLLIWGVYFPLAITILFAIIYFHNNAFKTLTAAECQFCGKRVKGQVGRKIGFIYTP